MFIESISQLRLFDICGGIWKGFIVSVLEQLGINFTWNFMQN